MNSTARTILIIVLILILLGSFPLSSNLGWGYYPSGGLGLVLLIVLILVLVGKL
jgi:hypothetical protein